MHNFTPSFNFHFLLVVNDWQIPATAVNTVEMESVAASGLLNFISICNFLEINTLVVWVIVQSTISGLKCGKKWCSCTIECCIDYIFLLANAEVNITLVSSTKKTIGFFHWLLGYCKKIRSVTNKSFWFLHILFIVIIFTINFKP